MFKKIRMGILSITVFLLSSCAYYFQGFHQSLVISTINDKLPEETLCELTNEEGVWFGFPNSPIYIHRDGNQMEIQCENEMQSGEIYVRPYFELYFLLLDLLVDWCTITCIVDGVTNSFYEYPFYLTIPMEDKKNQPFEGLKAHDENVVFE